MPATKNFRDTVGEALAVSKKHVVEALIKRMGPPPKAVAGRPQKDDDHDAYWKLGKGWEDPSQHAAKAQAMYDQGAKPGDVLKVMYPFRVELIPYGDRRDDLPAQVKFCDEMVARHFELLAEEAVALRDTMLSEGEGNGQLV